MLITLVKLAWWGRHESDLTSGHEEDDDDDYAEPSQSRKSDLYLAVFLVYPKISQTFFQHSYYRELSPNIEVLVQDYRIYCKNESDPPPEYFGFTLYDIFLYYSYAGLVCFSFGVPLGLFVAMWMRMRKELKLVHSGEKKRVVAYRDFGFSYDYIAGDFKCHAYYAECVDLLRKLILSGLMIFVKPGTVIQAFTSMMISYLFVLIHVKLWPYPSVGSNLLKLFTEVQLFLVLAISLVLQISDKQLAAEGFGRAFYSQLLGAVLLPLGVAIILKMTRKGKLERAQGLLLRMSKVDEEGKGKKSRRRKELHSTAQRSAGHRSHVEIELGEIESEQKKADFARERVLSTDARSDLA